MDKLENLKEFNVEFSNILNDRQYALLYGIIDYDNLPKDQVQRAREKLYQEFKGMNQV